MKPVMTILVAAILVSFSGYVFAQEEMKKDPAKKSMTDAQNENTATAKAVEIGNKICPVSGDEVPVPGEKSTMGDELVKYEYNGKIYNLCCQMCVKDFKKNPEKYGKIAEEEVAKEKMMEQKEDQKGTTK